MVGKPSAQQRLQEFLSAADENIDQGRLIALAGDASTRRYFRFIRPDGRSTVLTLYPEPFETDRFPYLDAFRLFDAVEIPVPQIVRMSGEQGIVEQQDLGNQTLQKHFGTCSSEERVRWLRLAIDLILQLQQNSPHHLDPNAAYSGVRFDREKLNWELNYYRRYFLGQYAEIAIEDETGLLEEFDQISTALAERSRVLCHRDYHFRNLMVCADRLYVIDFQDTRWGPVSYDLVSLLCDSISLGSSLRAELIHYFLSTQPELAGPEFEHEIRLMTVQRLLKALGTFGYQIRVRGIAQYEQYISDSLERIGEALAQLPGLERLKSVVEKSSSGS